MVGAGSTEALRALALGRAVGGGVDSSSDGRLGASSKLRALAVGAGVRDLCRPRAVGGGVAMSYIAGTAVGIVGTGIGAGDGGGGGGGPVVCVILMGLGSRFFPGFLTLIAPAPGGGGGGPPPEYCTISLAPGGGRR